MGGRGSSSKSSSVTNKAEEPRIKLNVKPGTEVYDIQDYKGAIIRETEKAVLARFATSTIDFKDEWGDWQTDTSDADVWLPKSQVEVIGNRVSKMPKWLFDKNKLLEDNRLWTAREKQKILSFEENKAKYSKVVEQAKLAGIKGVRKGVRYSTIKKMAKQQGIDFDIDKVK